MDWMMSLTEGKGVHWTDDKLIQFGIICYQTHMFTIFFRHKEGRETPISWLVTGNNNSGSDMFSYFRVCRLLKAKRNRARSGDSILFTLFFKEDLHFLNTHQFIV